MIESQHKKIKQRNKFMQIIALINQKGRVGKTTQKQLTINTNQNKFYKKRVFKRFVV